MKIKLEITISDNEYTEEKKEIQVQMQGFLIFEGSSDM